MEKRIKAIIIYISILLTLTACTKSAENRWQEQYDLGIRYLSDGNYEEAVIAFTAAIEIDPKRTEAYICLSEAYEVSNNLEEAISILELGYDNTGDESIREEIEVFLDKHSQLLITEEIVSIEDFKVNETSINACTIADFQAEYPSAPEEDWYYNPLTDYEKDGEIGVKYDPRVKVSGNGFRDWGVWTWAKSYDSTIELAMYYIDLDEFVFPIDFRTIEWGDSLEDVLRKLGFSERGIQFLSKEQYININVTDTGEWNIKRKNTDDLDIKNRAELDIFWHGLDGSFMFQFENDSLEIIQYYKFN